jgi:hypothetical protein
VTSEIFRFDAMAVRGGGGGANQGWGELNTRGGFQLLVSGLKGRRHVCKFTAWHVVYSLCGGRMHGMYGCKSNWMHKGILSSEKLMVVGCNWEHDTETTFTS